MKKNAKSISERELVEALTKDTTFFGEELPREKIEFIIAGLEVAGCLLCGKHPVKFLSVFETDSAEFGAFPGKTRRIFYKLCGECLPTEESADFVTRRVENEMIKIYAQMNK